MSFIPKGSLQEQDSWLDMMTSQRACEWCSGADGMREEFSKLCSEPWTAWPPQLLLDLKFCFDCVLEYHRIQDEFVEKELHYLRELQKADTERLCKSIQNSLQGAVKKEHGAVKIENCNNFELINWSHQLHVPMLEILRYPKLLFCKVLAAEFVRALIALDVQACPLSVEDKLPGVYLLLIHPQKQVRRWSLRCVQKLGPVDVDTYDNLKDVIKLMIAVLELNLFVNSDLIGADGAEAHRTDLALPDVLPPHLFVKDSVKDFWHGICMLVLHLEVETICRKFMSHSEHRTLLDMAANTLKYEVEEEGDSPFWPAVKCLCILIERLGSKTWFQLDPSKIFQAITEHAVYKAEIIKWDGYQGNETTLGEYPVDNDADSVSSSQGNNDAMPSTSRCTRPPSAQPQKTSLAWFLPFVQSLLDFGETYTDSLSQLICYAHDLSGKSIDGSILWVEAGAIIVRTIHQVLSKGLPSVVASVAHVWVPHVVTLSVFEQVDQQAVLPLVVTARRVIVMMLREIRKTQLSVSTLKFITYFSYSSGKSLVLTAIQKRELTELLKGYFQTGARKKLARDVQVRRTRRNNVSEKKASASHTRNDTAVAASNSKHQAKLTFDRPGPSNRGSSDSASTSHPRKKSGHAEAEHKVLKASVPLRDIRKHFDSAQTTRKSDSQRTEVSRCYASHGAVAKDPIVISDDEDEDEISTRINAVKREESTIGTRASSVEWLSQAGDDVEFSDAECDVAMVEELNQYEKTHPQKKSSNEDRGPQGATKRGVKSLSKRNLDAVPTSGKSNRKRRRLEHHWSDESGEDSDDVPLISLLKKEESTDSDSMVFSREPSSAWEAIPSSDEGSVAVKDGGHKVKASQQVQDWCEGVQSTAESQDGHMASALDSGDRAEQQQGMLCDKPELDDEYLSDEIPLSPTGFEFHDEEAIKDSSSVMDNTGNACNSREDFHQSEVNSPTERKGESSEFSLDAISKQLENQDAHDVEMSYWVDENFDNDLMWNSQDTLIKQELNDNLGTDSPRLDTSGDTQDLAEPLGEFIPELAEVSTASGLKESSSGLGHQAEDSLLASHSVGYANQALLRQTSTDFSEAIVEHREGIKGGLAAPLTALPPAIIESRKPISADAFLAEILKWKPDWVGQEGSAEGHPNINFLCRSIPLSFDDIDSYYARFKPLMLLEAWNQIVKDKTDGQNSKRQMTATAESISWLPGNFVKIRCSGKIGPEQAIHSIHPLESDLVIISFTNKCVAFPPDLPQHPSPVFGFVESIEKHTIRGAGSPTNTGPSRLSLIIKMHAAFRPPEKASLHIEHATSLLSTLRQLCGLMFIKKSRLALDILRPRRLEYFGVNDFVEDVAVSKQYNSSQERVLCTVAESVHLPYPIPRICLVQGPPGTGKSHTITGLISRIFNHDKSSHSQADGTSSVRTRILVCAPSNAAIDELIRRIVKEAPRAKNKPRNSTVAGKPLKILRNCGDFGLVRVGRKSRIHPSVAEWSLDNLVKARVTQSESGEGMVAQLKDQIKEVDKMLDLVERKCYEMQAAVEDNQAGIGKDEKEELCKKKRDLEWRYRKEKSKMEDRRRREMRIRREILAIADILCCTLNGSGAKALTEKLGGATAGQMPFTCVIVDEACQSCELDILIPLQLGSSKLVLVGDPEQLPATVLSRKAKEMLFDRSMFERFYRFFRTLKKERNIERPVLMLDVQYRMHPEIARFPSEHVYSRRLLTDSSLEQRPFALKTHYAFFDVVDGKEICREPGALWNPEEVKLVSELCVELIERNFLRESSIGIITPYRKQKTRLQDRLKERTSADIEVNTVDGFQGREKDVIIMSCVRARSIMGSIGFLGNSRRMNVALTRARHALYVFGHCKTLKSNRDWLALIQDAENRNLLFPVKQFSDFREVVLGQATPCEDHPSNVNPGITNSEPSNEKSGLETSRQPSSGMVRKRVTFKGLGDCGPNTRDDLSEGCSELRGETLYRTNQRSRDHGGVHFGSQRRGGRTETIGTVPCCDSGEQRTSGKPTRGAETSRDQYSRMETAHDCNLPSSADFGDDKFYFDSLSEDEDEALKVKGRGPEIDTCQSSEINSTSEGAHAHCQSPNGSGDDDQNPSHVDRADGDNSPHRGRAESDESLPHRGYEGKSLHFSDISVGCSRGTTRRGPDINDNLPDRSSHLHCVGHGVGERRPRAGPTLDAQPVVDRIKARHPPQRGPPIIPATRELISKKWKPHGGPRERRAHAEGQEVRDTRRRGSACDVPTYQAKQPSLSHLREKFAKRK